MIVAILLAAYLASSEVGLAPGEVGLAPGEVGLERAREAFDVGHTDEAVEILSILLTEGGEEGHAARLLLAEVRIAQGLPQDALALLSGHVADDDALGLLMTGYAYAHRGWSLADAGAHPVDFRYFLGEAAQAFEQSAALAPRGDTEAAIEAGYLLLYDFNDPERVIGLTEAALAGAPEDGEAWLLQGCARVHAYDVLVAGGADARTLRSAFEQTRDDLLTAARLLGDERGEPWWQLRWLYMAHDEPEAAVAAAIHHHDHTPDAEPDGLLELALRYGAEQRWSAAAEALTGLVERDPEGLTAALTSLDDGEAGAVTLGWVIVSHISRRNRAQAFKAYATILPIDPRHAGFWNDYGLLCRDAGRYEDSYAAYEKSLAVDDTDPRVLNDTALILQYHLHRDLPRARELYERAITLAERQLETGVDSRQASNLRSALRDAKNNLRRL